VKGEASRDQDDCDDGNGERSAAKAHVGTVLPLLRFRC